jgi:N-acetylglucosamine kinase
MHYGIDIGGTKTEFAVFDETFKRISSHRYPTVTGDYDRLVSSIVSAVEQADDDLGQHGSIGVGVPGILDQSGRSFSANVPCLNGNMVRKDLAGLIGRPVRCINDVRAFALSEAHGGAADGFETMVGIILGTGAASGYCQKGDLNLGVNGVAGEWGHLPLVSTLFVKHGLPIWPCSCGSVACNELYVSGPGLSRIAEHTLGRELEPEECIALKIGGDPLATKAVNIWLDCVASVFAQIILHLDPEVIVLGGGMSNVTELYDSLPELIEPQLFSGIALPPIHQAVFGDDSGVRGAAIIGTRA